MNPITKHYLLDAVFRILFHEEQAVHLNALAVLAANHVNVSFEEMLVVLQADERFVSTDDIYWSLAAPWRSRQLDTSLRDTTFVVTDIECTGSNFLQERIIEIGAVKLCGGRVIDEFHSFVNPQRSVSVHIYRLTGIKPAQLAQAPTIDTVLRDYAEFLGDHIFAAHNCDFDLRFIYAEFHRLGIDAFNYVPELCTLRLARKILTELTHHGLAKLSEYFEYYPRKRHSAIEDAKATGFCLSKMIERFDPTNLKTGQALINRQLKMKGAKKLLNDARRMTWKQKHRNKL